MNSFENAKTFFHNCESAKGWEACAEYVEGEGKFKCQSQALAEVNDIKTYVEWIEGLSNVTMPGSSYNVHSSAYDEENNTAIFFSTFNGTHSGDGGPIPPTNKTTHTDYVYALKMNDQGKVKSMTKIWNAPWALRELGWM
ncbi:hypothetical protein [Aestuariivivens insulae]|uniref:hypothetical protein n=1 Tax=Aestuariivivens insulae TaxID=1621988 RepID=UPI001F5A09A2|nr:hypothetical protein [Aestuariivivens insulae]